MHISEPGRWSSATDKPVSETFGLPGNRWFEVAISIGIDCQLIIEDNGTNLRLEPGREGSGRQGLKSENVKNGKSSFGMELDYDILVTASHSDDEHNADTRLDETKLSSHLAGVEVDCRGRIRGVDFRPQTRSNDSNVGETNWSRAFARVGTTRSGTPLSAVEVQGTGVSRCRRKLAWTAE
ncbi:hypothetical protein L1987_18960 [Smallanthus sonchifolius]|uniref:Uncharacterized protein n=1 Tax=Smallanthus sonchifolius TaxID=185202 RepID=A0ACB9J4N4_9ASTR|nr:hypothetical protein L1987_18960 [Smallanthus sonchifolius]